MESAHQTNRAVALLASIGGTILALIMLSKFFHLLDVGGYPVVAISVLLIFVGIFSLSSSKGNYLPSLFIILIGLFAFAEQINLLGSGVAPWLWPLFVGLFAILSLVMLVKPSSNS